MRVSTQFRQPILTLTLSILFFLSVPAAHAQISGSAGILSNYMYRGVSLSDDKAAVRLALNYDDTAGWFAGGQVVSGQLSTENSRHAQWTAYAGYAQRLSSGLAWETGMTSYSFPSSPNWNFQEIYAGLSGEALNVRLHYSPDYLGFGERTLYAEINSGWALMQRWQAFLHGGYLYSRDNARNSLSEARMGIATSYYGWQAQVSLDLTRLHGARKSEFYGTASSGEWQRKIVFSVGRSF
ncbi:hypothetical protein Undi14_09475 [Undibacterium sp. 14-3-2]|uniref:TorF family putative porin n=1 Tax=Undibacterium sp. 14-3-2 TaxID=2800129 RepID=UPI001902E6EF|nr:TorF family putative porin [Undibacterium sp. 14-3-2]MBK1890271.1 hypothetical protein [Undibacterium sp. 14-3-2]